MRPIQLQACGLVLCLFTLQTGLLAQTKLATTEAPEGVVETNYLGWSDCYVLSGSLVRAVVVPGLGGRILEYSSKGENILYQSAHCTRSAQTNTTSGELLGGYQADVGPESRVLPSHDLLWKGPYEAKPLEEFGLSLRSPTDARLGVQLEKEILIDPESGELGLTQRLRNTSGRTTTSYCLWDRTLCKGGGFAFFPLKKKSHYPAKWALQKSVQGKITYDGAKPQSPQVKVIDGVLVAKCDGQPTRLGADTDAGWIGYVRGRWLFVKYFLYSPKGHYPESGNTVELYFDAQVAGLEPLSPEMRLQNGEALDFPEKWSLIEVDNKITSFDQVRALVDRIPPSPFR